MLHSSNPRHLTPSNNGVGKIEIQTLCPKIDKAITSLEEISHLKKNSLAQCIATFMPWQKTMARGTGVRRKVGLVRMLSVGALAIAVSGGCCAASDAPLSASWTLQELVHSAISTNPRVLASRAAVARADADVDSARLQFLPTPSISAEHREGRQMEIYSLRQPIWTGGKLTSALAVANAQQEIAALSVDEVRYDMASRVASAWSDAQSARGQLTILTDELQELGALQGMMKRRLATGLSAQAELDLLGSRLSQARSDFSAIQAQLRSSTEQLSQMTGEKVTADQLADLDPTAERFDVTESEVIQRALATHPTLARLSAEVRAADARAKQARSQMMPSLFATFEYQQGQTDGARLPGSRTFFGVEQSFGAGFSSFEGVRAAQAGRDAANEAYLSARRDISAQATTDAQTYIAALRKSEEGALNLDGVERVYASYKRMFLAGKRSWLDLLNMVREQTDVARMLSAARANSDLYAFRVKLLCGEAL
ncbi:adhesin transport system outer membrane protein [Pseudomonas fluorescens]|uniref:TolC family protein n=1 Tax=Pseudomonas fluorescens TaxID=294 RepID=UPI00209EA59F|nr:TolC family protein [Pseudomonas fluorescens]MCP1489752.1 adhesin transport system outer membrane protein [Pseudomonas fluorescens]